MKPGDKFKLGPRCRGYQGYGRLLEVQSISEHETMINGVPHGTTMVGYRYGESVYGVPEEWCELIDMAPVDDERILISLPRKLAERIAAGVHTKLDIEGFAQAFRAAEA